MFVRRSLARVLSGPDKRGFQPGCLRRADVQNEHVEACRMTRHTKMAFSVCAITVLTALLPRVHAGRFTGTITRFDGALETEFKDAVQIGDQVVIEITFSDVANQGPLSDVGVFRDTDAISSVAVSIGDTTATRWNLSFRHVLPQYLRLSTQSAAVLQRGKIARMARAMTATALSVETIPTAGQLCRLVCTSRAYTIRSIPRPLERRSRSQQRPSTETAIPCRRTMSGFCGMLGHLLTIAPR